MAANEFLEPFERMLESVFPPSQVRALERGAPRDAAWSELEQSGFLDALVPEESGGGGLPLAEIAPLLIALGRHAVPLPVGETIVARAILAAAGATAPSGAIALAPAPGLVIGALGAEWILCAGGDGVSLSAAADVATAVPAPRSLDGLWNGRTESGQSVAAGADSLVAHAAVVHAAAIAGAADRLLAMTVGYANERVQFGKPIGRQQAVQQQLAAMAEDTVAVRIAVELACDGALTSLGAAVAKSVASAAAPRIANTAHAVHGAIGISEEHDLQLYSRRLHAWRLAGGAETRFDRSIGQAVLADEASAVDWVRENLFSRL